MLLLTALAAHLAAATPTIPAAHDWAVRDVRLTAAEDAARVTILLGDGRIRAIQDVEAEIPPGHRIHEGEGHLAVPAFIDAYSHTGCETPSPVADRDLPTDVRADVDVAMRAANRKGIQPAFRAAEAFALEEKAGETWRGQGFGALLSAPHGEILAGSSTLAVTRAAAARDALLVPDVFFHGAFAASGEGYPGTLMGYCAQLRQFAFDAAHHADHALRWQAGGDVIRPAFDADLDAGAALFGGEQRLFVEADGVRDLRRWMRLSDELGLAIGFAGGREAWEVAAEVHQRGIPVVLTLDWGEEAKDPGAAERRKRAAEERPEEPLEADEPPAAEAPPEESDTSSEEAEAEEEEADPWTYDEPLAVRTERRRLWEEGRDCALRLAEAEVPFAFGTGSGDAKKLLKNVRALVEEGLPADVALAALTGDAAAILAGPERRVRLGRIEPGFDATIALWTVHPLEKDALLAALFVDGVRHEFDLEEAAGLEGAPAEGVDASGVWTITQEGMGRTIEMELTLSMAEDGEVTGTFTREGPEGTIDGAVEGRVAGTTLEYSGSYEMGDMEIRFRFRGELDGDAVDGETAVTASFGDFTMETSGTRAPGRRSDARSDAGSRDSWLEDASDHSGCACDVIDDATGEVIR